MAAAAPRPMSSENILKQGYLKKSVLTSELIPSASKQLANNIKQKLEPNRWYVFGVRNRRPYLEYFDKEESIFTGQAIHSYDLSTFQNLSYTMGRTNTNFTFCIFLADTVIDLTAPSRAHMVDWCRCLERHLRNLGLRSKNQKEDHQYTAFPVKKVPRPPAEEPPDLDDGLDMFIVNDESGDSEEENHDYQDLPCDIDGAEGKALEDSTLPIRPPPRVPKRINEEDVFADLSTVRRDEMYINLEGHTNEITEGEQHLFGENTDSDSDDEDKDKADEATGHTNDTFEEDSEDRCTSLPNIQTLTQESDTSEDSDFIPASFWLRNRRSDLAPLDLRYDPSSVEIRSKELKPQPKPRNCVSMTASTLMSLNSVHAGSSDEQPGDGTPELPARLHKPPPTKCSNHTPVGRKKSNEGTLVIVDHVAKCENGNSVFLLDDEPDGRDTECKIHIGKPGIGNDKKDIAFDNDYETLAHTQEKGNKVVEKSNKPTDDVYEAAWMCHTAKKPSNDNDDCFKKDLKVDLPKDKNGKSSEHANVDISHESNSKDYTKPKGIFNRLLSRKSKSSKDLPESLVVELPPNSCKDSNNCNNSDTEHLGENYYSDFPLSGEEPVLDSDIRKLSILQNNPSVNNDAPIELPPRHFAERSAWSSNGDSKFKTVVKVSSGAKQKGNVLSKSVGDSPQCFELDTYEPIDVSKTTDAYKNRHPVPIPEKSHTRNLIDLDFESTFEAPIAPPRRKKSDKMSAGSSPELPIRKQRSPVSPPTPKKRQSVQLPIEKRNQEPTVPPRPHHQGKPALPPPPRPAPITRTASDASVVGGRPKTIHLASRQKSTSQPSAVHVMNLKQNQVDILRSEIETGGLVKLISKMHFQNGLAFVECFGKIWVAGWDVKKYPKLYDKFHIGDELTSINDVQVSDLAFANKLVKNVKAESIEISIRRLPYARVFAIQRSGEGESLGIKREGGTSEILYVDPLGLASKHGLTSKAVTLDGTSHCNWCLTEINMRALNLFFKDHEIEHRLLAVGRDISIVVQPVDLIKEIKKQLKKHKSYKDYLIH